MKVLILYNDGYGRRVSDFLNKRGGFQFMELELDLRLPQVVDEPSDFLPEVPETDLILFLIQDSGIIQLLPDIARMSGAKAVVVAVDSPTWLPRGLELQIGNSLIKLGVSCVFARPLCTLKETGDECIDLFASVFGLPVVELELDGGLVEAVTVKRSAPCGSTFFIAENLRGVSKDDAVGKAGLLFHNYPCMASMEYDKVVGETLMHIAGYKLKNAVRDALEEAE